MSSTAKARTTKERQRWRGAAVIAAVIAAAVLAVAKH